MSLGNLKQYEAAIETLQQVIQAEARHAEAYNSLGFLYHQQGNIPQAIEYYKQALAIQPDFDQAQQNLQIALRESQ